MTCPCCGNEMKNGYLVGGGISMIWSPVETDCVLPLEERGDFLLSRGPFKKNTSTRAAFYCEQCNMLIMPNARPPKKSKKEK